jgi:anti-sigma B factor antagonist
MEVTEASVLRLPFAAASVGVARRRLVADLIAAGVYDSAVRDVALVISELLSNALRHAVPLPGSKIRVAWRIEPDSIQVSVSDGGGPTRPELGEPTQGATGGRGLRIVEKLSSRWGTSTGEEGATVWAEVPARPVEQGTAMTAVGARVGRLTSRAGLPAGLTYPPNSKDALSVVAWLPRARRGKVRHVELNVSSRFHDDHTIVTISGEIDLYTAPRLHSELGAVLVDGMPTRVVIDMSGVEFCDSTGMNVLLSCLRRVRERGGELEIASPKPAVRKILQVTGLDSVFTLVEDPGLSRPKPAVPQ